MAKKVIYKITKTTYEIVEVETPEQEALIAELNRDTEREEKRTQVNKARYRSLEQMQEEGFEPADTSPSWVDKKIADEEVAERNERLYAAIRKLTPRQQEMVIMVYFKHIPQEEVAKRYGITKSAVSHAMERIYASLRRFLEEI